MDDINVVRSLTVAEDMYFSDETLVIERWQWNVDDHNDCAST